jgi:gluconolactonase
VYHATGESFRDLLLGLVDQLQPRLLVGRGLELCERAVDLRVAAAHVVRGARAFSHHNGYPGRTTRWERWLTRTVSRWDGDAMSSSSPAVDVLYRTSGGLLEGPRFDTALGLMFSDAHGGGVFALDASLVPGSAPTRTLIAHRRGIGGLARHEAGGLVVSGRNLAYKPLDVGGVPGDTTVLLETTPPATGFNDLTVDGRGRVYVGTLTELAMVDPPAARGGAVLVVDTDGSTRVVADDFRVPNGMAPSPDGSVLYVVDSGRRVVFAFDVDEDSGALAARRVVVEVATGVPDGMAVAADGSIWIAQAYAGIVGRYAADGTLVATWAMPHAFVTSLCFGGADNRQLFVTTGSEEPEGDAVICTTTVDVPGADVAPARVRLDASPAGGA